MHISKGTHYLISKIAELEAAMASMVEQVADKDARITELEKNQKKVKESKST